MSILHSNFEVMFISLLFGFLWYSVRKNSENYAAVENNSQGEVEDYKDQGCIRN